MKLYRLHHSGTLNYMAELQVASCYISICRFKKDVLLDFWGTKDAAKPNKYVCNLPAPSYHLNPQDVKHPMFATKVLVEMP